MSFRRTHYICLIFYLAAGTASLVIDADSQSPCPPFITPAPMAIPSRVEKRQTGVATLTAPTPTRPTEYWRPLLSADVSPTAATSSDIPIYISFLSNIPSTSDSNAVPTESSSTISQPDSSTLSSSSSSPSSALPSAALNATKSPFNLLDLIPAFGVVGFFLIGLGIWVLYGCLTRKPRVLKHDDGGELITGPPYTSLHNSGPHRDVEQRGHEEDMISVRKYGQAHDDAQYRWPSYSEPPVFEQKSGFHAPKRYLHDHGYDEDDGEDTTLLSAGLEAPGRRRSTTRALRPSSVARAAPLTGASLLAVSREHSSATSAALHELYESDSEEDARRRAQEPPWESLRHKSIKRGILDQVKKESTWMDSVRSSLMGVGASEVATPKRQRRSVALAYDEKSTREEEEKDVRASSSSNKVRSGVGRRRGHVRANSDVHIADDLNAMARNPVAQEKNPIPTPERPHRQHRNSNDIITPPPMLARGRRSYAWLKDAEDEDRYTPLPARLHSSRSRSPNRSESRSRSRSRSKSRSSSPVKPLLARRGTPTATRSVGYSASARALDILPQSPPQILSPPLESQICFTPIPPLNLGSKITSATRSSSRGDSAIPTRIPSPKKKTSSGMTRDTSRSRSRQRSTVRSSADDSTSAFSPPASASVSTSASATREAARTGWRRHIPSPRGSATSPARGDGTRAPLLARREMLEDEVGTDSIMRKVDQIMEVGWNERDLGLEGMRSLSPTGFGRDV